MDSEQRGEQAAQAAGSGGKKRRRRTAAQIDRKFACNYPGCSKAYGSEGSLTQHQRLKHPQSAKEALAAARKAQSLTMSLMLACCPLYKLSAMFLPRPASGSLKGGATLPPSAAPAVRAVNIRPATMGVLPGSPFQVGSPAHAASPMPPLAPDALGEIRNASSTLRIMRAASEDAAMGGHRNLRSRSNSMPISISAPLPAQSQRAAPSSTRTPSQRKARGSSTPRPKSTTARRAKARSKSESLTGLPGFPPADIIQPPRSDRSVSDSTASTHESIAPIEISDAQAFRSSWSVSDPVTMEEQAIDSDILSVLADCDSNELGSDGQSIDVPRAPRSAPVVPFNSPAFTNMEDQEMLPAGLECFKIAEGIPSVELTRAVKRKPFTDQLSFQHNVDKVNVGATGIRGGPGCLFGVPDALISEGKVGNHASNLELVPPHVGAFGDISDAFTLQPYDAPIENDSHNLSHMNSYSDNGAMDFANIDALAPIQTFHAADATSKDPGTPLQGISTKVQKLNIESEACWSDAAILLNEPDREESLSQQHNHQQALWDKGDPFSSSLESGHADSIQDPTAHDSTSGTDWGSSKGTASAAANYYFGTPSSHSEGTPTRYFGDILMSDATEFAMVDSRAQSHLLGQNDDLI